MSDPTPFQLPEKVPVARFRPAQSNVPASRKVRDQIKQLTKDYVASQTIVPPMPMAELREHAKHLLTEHGLDAVYEDFTAVYLNNAAWSDTLAQIPYERRLLLLSKCLRDEKNCPAPFDALGLLCKECGLCSLQDLGAEAERLGYAVLVAEGSAIVRQMIETGQIEAVIGVSCLNVLERSFPHMEAAAVPGVAIPLLNDDCIDCTVDLDQVWDIIHLNSDDQTFRLDLDALQTEVKAWFTSERLDSLMGEALDVTASVARDWLLRDGKRWRPYLATCVFTALECDGTGAEPSFPLDLQKLAVAIECFHKASLIHDDIEDGDAVRYGQPTVHAEHGEAIAINVGDFLLGEGYRLIAEVDAPAVAKVEMLRVAAVGHVTLSRGQGTELAWARNPEPIPAVDVLKIFKQKTAPAFEVALRLGALFGGAEDSVHEVLATYSEAIGIAYQICDDLDDFTEEGDSNDLEDLRPSLILAIASKRAKAGAERELIESLWRREADYAVVGDEIQRIVRERGVAEKASELLQAYEEEAVRSLRFLNNATLKGLLRRVVGKIFPRTLIEGYCSEFEARNAAGGEASTEATR